MIPLALRITNFRSFRGMQMFTFPQEPGLYFMQGVNEAEPRLGANGAGKSTIWDALSWVGFEKTPSKLKAGDVCNWDASKGTEVAFIYLRADGEPCKLVRTWGPNSWTLEFDDEKIDLTKASNNVFLDTLRLTFTPFLNSIMTAQRQPMFLDLEHTQQATLFSDVMGLDRWLDYSTKASKKASVQDAVTRGLERELSNLRGKLEGISDQDFQEDAREWEAKQNSRLKELDAEYDERVERNEKLRAGVESAQAAESRRREVVRELQPDERDEKLLAKLRDLVATVQADIRVEQHKAEEYAKHLQLLLDDKECPTCKQRLSLALRNKEVERAEGAAKEMVARVTALHREYEDERAALEAHTRKMSKNEQKLRDARVDLDDAVRATGGARRALELNERELDRLEERTAELEREVNPYEEMKEKAQREGARLREEIEVTQRKLDESAARYSLLSYWVRGFKEIRLVQIAEALTELEVEVNSSVMALGLVDWELSFQVDRETKSGNIQRGFNAFVRSPCNDRAVPWEAWSGGEAQRLRVAATMGLSDLIRSRTGTPLNLEVWDEPSTGLSPEGINDLLEALAERARVNQRQIWIVDHSSHDFGGFAGGAVITKTDKGSSIRQY